MRIKSLLLIAFITILALFVVTCHEKKSTTPEIQTLKPGIIEFKNQGNINTRIEYYYQTRGGKTSSQRPWKYVPVGQSYMLPNLMDGGITFKGGDEVGVKFICYFSSTAPRKSAKLIVDGDKHIVIGNRCSCSTD